MAEPNRAPDTSAAPTAAPPLGRDLLVYSLSRFAVVAVVAVALALVGVPLLFGIAVGLIVGLPVSVLLFRERHNRVVAALGARGASRRAQRERLRAQLRGELAGADPEMTDQSRASH